MTKIINICSPLYCWLLCTWVLACYIHLLWHNLQIRKRLPVAFGKEQTSSGGTQPSLSVSTLNHNTLVGGQTVVATSLPICSLLQAFFLPHTPYPAGGAFSLLPHPTSCLFIAPFVQAQSWQPQDWVGWETSAANFHREKPCPPSFVLALLKQGLVLPGLPLMSLFASLPPWYCQFNRNYFLVSVDHGTMSGRRVACTTSGTCSLFPTLTLISQDLSVCKRLGFDLLVEKGLAPI